MPNPPAKKPVVEELPTPTIRAEGGGFRAYTENGCVFADTAEEAILKHQERIKGRAKKGWPAKGKKKIK